ncbi:hypothetical protein ASG40_11735 [Methylobacterium sp. Leaf399]|uniref:hypothetical protein n=1 Tax=Methylobacterium sp. Leaf399 TaxID=1736364 RepID=UPI0006FF8B97|nr:hypothetical protein [Methylobacterium sp. Leaf399]KQT08542.1 hypothetical protein ASG40_11735 [Methylobacterium sp. Leaf399]
MGELENYRTPDGDADTLQADLSELLAMLGMGDHARPQSPHEVFQEALTELRKRLAPRAPTLSGPRREKAHAIAEAAANRWGKFDDRSGVGWLVDQIIFLKTEDDDRMVAWANRSVEQVQDSCFTEVDRLRAGIADVLAVCESDARDQDHNGGTTSDKRLKAYTEGRGTACRGIAAQLRALVDPSPSPERTDP